MNLQLNDLLNKKMDRRDFLKYVGVGFLALTGVASVLKFVESQTQPQAKTASGTGGSMAYGAMAYGGKRAS